MSAGYLRDHSMSFLSCFESAYWKEAVFASFKKEIELLIESLLGYQNYLEASGTPMS